MLRLVGFFLLVFVTLGLARSLLGGVPIIGALLGMPFVGFWIVAVALSAGASRLAAGALDRRQAQRLVSQLGTVETPHNQGKLGSLLLSQGRARRAIEPLERATAGEPEVAEWHYRLGCALLEVGRKPQALAALDAALVLDEEHAYGETMLRSIELVQSMGEHAQALARLKRYRRNHGPSPESAFRRGQSLAAAGDGKAAREAFDEVQELAGQLAQYQRRGAAAWQLRARLARARTRG
jgi:tetratricopeptide (TPR) repeat protein